MSRNRRSRASKKRASWAENPVILTIESLSHEGRGVAKHEGKTVFVEGALPGEVVEAVYTQRRSSFDEATIKALLTPSSQRVTPPCQYAGYCGGCSLQHLDPAEAVQFKDTVLQEQLRHFAGQLPDEGMMTPMTGPTEQYRRRARLAVKHVPKKGGVLVGFREKQSHFVADIERCIVLDPRVGELITPLKALIEGLSVKAALPQIEVAMGTPSPSQSQSQSQALAAETSSAETSSAEASSAEVSSVETSERIDQDNQVALIFRHLDPISEDDQKQLNQFADKHHVDIYLQSKGLDTVKKVYPVVGDSVEACGEASVESAETDVEASEQAGPGGGNRYERLQYHLPEHNVEFNFHPIDFTQVNSDINEKMVTLALELLELQPTDRVLDLFCGLGNFTLPMARRAAHVTGVEGGDLMVERGYENAKLNGIDNVAFFAQNLFSDPESWSAEWAGAEYDKILLDPPRSGAQEIVSVIERFAAPRIVYVSCNPATLARDTGILLSKGYRLVQAGVMDMFPHTAHVESIALFELNNR